MDQFLKYELKHCKSVREYWAKTWLHIEVELHMLSKVRFKTENKLEL